jgi:hypothetical protein
MSLQKGALNRPKAVSVYNRRDTRARADELYEMFLNNFRKTLGNPAAMSKYLEEKEAQHRHAWASVKYKFEAARDANNKVVAAINYWHAQTYVIKVTCDAAMVVIGAFLPVSWVVNTAIGFSYSLLCKIAANTSDARDTSILAYGANNMASQWGNQAQDAVDTNAGLAVKAARAKLFEDAQKQSMDATAKFVEKLRQFTAQSGKNLTAAQERRLAPVAAKAQQALSNLETARQGVAAEVKGASAVFREAPPAAKASMAGARAAGIAVGLLFIVPDAIAAVQEVRTNILQENTR